MTDSVSATSRPAPPPRVIGLGAAARGVRLDLFLAAELGLSRGQVRRLLESGAVRLDGRPMRLGDKGLLLPGAGELEVASWRPPAEQAIPLPGAGARSGAGAARPVVLAEGPGWLALDKPAGMPVHPLREDERDTVLGHVAARRPEVQGVGEGGLRSGVVHRLDVDTSGVLLVATDEATWRRLRDAFQRHAVEKTYRAIVSGRFDPPGGELRVRLPLVVARHRPSVVRVARDDEVARGRAREVRQTVRPIEQLAGATLVEVRPVTGFLHQIRATLAHLGHPLLGDRRYADDAVAAEAPRHMLHATRVRFEEIDARAPLPDDFLACLEARRA
jgi:23S rRNA pseudouridine1911/1915/1917 synthase